MKGTVARCLGYQQLRMSAQVPTPPLNGRLDELERGIDACKLARRVEMVYAVQRDEGRVRSASTKRLCRTGEILVADDHEGRSGHPCEVIGRKPFVRATNARRYRDSGSFPALSAKVQEEPRRDIRRLGSTLERICERARVTVA